MVIESIKIDSHEHKNGKPDSSIIRFRFSDGSEIKELTGEQVTDKMRSFISLLQKCEDRENLGCVGCPKERCDKGAYRNGLEEEILKAANSIKEASENEKLKAAAV